MDKELVDTTKERKPTLADAYATSRRDFWHDVASLLKCGLSDTEIRAFFGIRAPKYLERITQIEKGMSWQEWADDKRAIGSADLKIAAHRLAVGKNDKTMLIFLLKNRAGYADQLVQNVQMDQQALEFSQAFMKFVEAMPADPTQMDVTRVNNLSDVIPITR